MIFSGAAYTFGRYSANSLVASKAYISVMTEEAFETYASKAWHRASMPVAAVSSGLMVMVISGSISARSGSIILLTMPNLRFLCSSVITAN